MLLNCLYLFFIYLKLELLREFPDSDEEKICLFMKIDMSKIELFNEHKLNLIIFNDI